MNDASDPRRNEAHAALAAEILQQGIEGASFASILDTYCVRLVAAGLALQRVNVSLRAHHPEFGSMGFRWRRGRGISHEKFSHLDHPRDEWVRSPLFHLLQNDMAELRQNLTDPEPAYVFEFFDDLIADGATDYFAAKVLFGKPGETLAVDPTNTPEGMVISWASGAVSGFSDDDLAGLRRLLPPLSLALKSTSNRQMAQDLATTYLGRDAGQRVLLGDILRGSCETISAVIWYFDLKGFTRMSETLPGPAIIDLLNDYFAAVVAIVEDHGGNVLKFMGDGLLAIFPIDGKDDANTRAVNAAVTLRDALGDLNEGRAAQSLPTSGFALALHAGDVLYGNIGGRSRLDFTVIGPAVNTTARILGMCSHVDQNIIVSSDVAGPLLPGRDDLVSLGQYRLRGVSARQELFSLD